MLIKKSPILIVVALCSLTLRAGKQELSQSILSAKTVVVIARTGSVGTGKYVPSASRAKAQVEKELRKWNRYEIVEDPNTADLIFVLVEGHAAANNPSFVADRTFARTADRDVLTDTLSVFKGGVLDESSDPLWRRTEMGDDFTWPAERVIKRFRRDVEKFSK